MKRWISVCKRRWQKRQLKVTLQAQLDAIYRAHEDDVASAKTQEERERAESLRAFECAEFDDQLQRLNFLELNERARRCHIDLSDLPANPDAPYHLKQGSHGTWLLHPRSFRALAKTVETAEHERDKRNIDRRDF